MSQSRIPRVAAKAAIALTSTALLAACAPAPGGDGARPCERAGYARVDGFCKDVDECALGSHTCDQNAACTNTPGGFTCTCKPGFAGDGRQCRDVDECKLGTANCPAGSVCRNTVGGYGCACKPGFALSGGTCRDVDECKTGKAACSADATCRNTVGGYACACKPGFTGDGRTCKDIDECALGSHTCDSNATCRNTAGSYTCACKPGFTGDGRTCKDIDECAVAHGCSPDATCANTPGSYTCTCKPGYYGDGRTCHAGSAVREIAAGGASVAIPGKGSVCLPLAVPPTPQHVVQAVRVSVSVTHAAASDLTLSVVAPDGTRVPLAEGLPAGVSFEAKRAVTFGDGYSETLHAYVGRVRPRVVCDGVATCGFRPSVKSAALAADARLGRLAGREGFGTWKVCADNAGAITGNLARAAIILDARCETGIDGRPACRCPDRMTFKGTACVPRSPGSNRPPVVAAGPDKTVASSDAMVTLTATASDPDGDLKSITWQQVSGPPVILLDASRPKVSFRAPIVLVPAKVKLAVTARDSFGAAARDEVEVSFTPYGGVLSHRLLVVLVASPGTSPAVEPADVHRAIFAGAVRDYYTAMSAGRHAFTGTTSATWIRTTVPAADPTGACRTPGAMLSAMGDIKGVGEDPSLYTGAVVLFSAGCDGVDASVRTLSVDGKRASLPVVAARLDTGDLTAPLLGRVRSSTGGVRAFPLVPAARPAFTAFAGSFARAYGFMLGLPAPAARIFCKVGSLDGDCTTDAAGDPLDLAGSGAYALHLSGPYLDHLGWLAAGEKVEVRSTQTVTLAPLESAGKARVAVIWPRGTDPQPYYVEFRQPKGYDAGLSQPEVAVNAAGIVIRRRTAVYAGGKLVRYGRSVLIDASPARSGFLDTVALAPGSTFADTRGGVVIGDVRVVHGVSATFRVTLR